MTVWNDEKIEQLKTLYNAGLSCSQIGSRLGFSRNAIIGKVHRLGMPRRGKNGSLQVAKSVRHSGWMKEAAKKKAKAESRAWNSNGLPPTKRDSDAAPRRPKLPPDNDFRSVEEKMAADKATKTLAHLEPNDCRWPVGDPVRAPATFGFCGCAKMPGSSYCEPHFRRSLNPGVTPRRPAVRPMERIPTFSDMEKV